MKPAFALIAALILSPVTALAHDQTIGDLQIIHPNIPQPREGAISAALYMALSNEGTMADRLIGVETPVAKAASLHESRVDAVGVASMVPLEAVDLPAGETVVLEPGGIHVMLMGLTTPLHEGDMVPATLIFEQAGRVDMQFMIDPPAGVDASTMDHSKMDHGTGG